MPAAVVPAPLYVPVPGTPLVTDANATETGALLKQTDVSAG